jgi:O-antigen/teichoic acid export membrane protein
MPLAEVGREASVALAGQLCGKSIQLANQVVLARLLGSQLFGLYAIGWSLFRFLLLFAPLGLHNAALRFGGVWEPGDPRLRATVWRSLVAAVGSGMVAGVALGLASGWLADTVFSMPDLAPVLRGFSMALPLAAGLMVIAAATRISKRMKYSVLAEEIVRPLVFLMLFLALYRAGDGLGAAIVAVVVSYFAAFVLAAGFAKLLFGGRPSARLDTQGSTDAGADTRQAPGWAALLRFSVPTAFAGSFGAAVLWSDRLLLGYFRPPEDVGVYQAAAQTSVVFALVLTGLNAIVTPLIVSYLRDGRTSDLDRLFKASTRWGLMLTLPFAVILFGLSRELLTVVFGPGYAPAAVALRILVVGQLVNVGTGAVAMLLIMSGRQRLWLIIGGCAFALSCALNWLWIPRYGIDGAAAGTSVSVAIMFLVALMIVRRQLRVWPYDRSTMKLAVAAALALAATLFVTRIDELQTMARLIAGIVTAGLTFSGAVALLGLGDEDREVARTAVSALRRLLRRH